MIKPVTYNDANSGLTLYITDCSQVTEPGLLAHYKSWLSDKELLRLGMFRHSEDRNCYLTGRALMREVLSAEASVSPQELQIETTESGKPYLIQSENPNGSTTDFSLSHTGQICALAISRAGRVGVDIENVRRKTDITAIAERYFDRKEAQDLSFLQSKDQQQTFMSLWTLKEAYCKMNGLGIAGISMTGVVFDVKKLASGTITPVSRTVHPKSGLHFNRLIYQKDYQIALAYEAEQQQTVSCLKVVPGDNSKTEVLDRLLINNTGFVGLT